MLYVSVSSVTKPTECRSDGDCRRHGYLVRIQKKRELHTEAEYLVANKSVLRIRIKKCLLYPDPGVEKA